MRLLPNSDDPLVVRTDFSNDRVWQEVRDRISAPVEYPDMVFYAYVTFLSDSSFQDATKVQLLNALPREYDHGFLCIADSMTMSHLENPILVVGLYEESGREFRALPEAIQAIENNLSIANMDFQDFADSVDVDGLFRGFK